MPHESKKPGRPVVAWICAAIVAVSCGGTVVPSASAPGERSSQPALPPSATQPSSTGTPAAVPTGAPSTLTPTVAPTPTAVPVDASLTLAVPVIEGLTNFPRDSPPIGRLFMYQGLYRLDDMYRYVPDLADKPCDIPADGRTITCHIGNTTFHDGVPVTAGDVAFTFQIQLSDHGNFPNPPGLTSVRALDGRTVQFSLDHPSPQLFEELAAMGIEPRHVLEAQYAAIRVTAMKVGTARLDAAVARIQKAFDADVPDCAALIPDAEALAIEAGLQPPDHAWFVSAQGNQFEPCDDAGRLQSMFQVTSESLTVSGVDAIAAAYTALPIQVHPIGSGPYEFSSLDPGKVLVMTAFPGFQRGVAATSTVKIVAVRDALALADGLRSGNIDVAPRFDHEIYGLPDASDAVRDVPGLRVTGAPGTGWVGLAFNLRAGRLFHDPNLRHALNLCIDKTAIVSASTGDGAVPISGPIVPGSWAYQDLPAVVRDVKGGRALIEASGWKPGADGIYELAGRRLAAVLPVRDNRPDRVKFAQLVALQARDCGFDLTPTPYSIDDLFNMISTIPENLPGTDTPFDIYAAAWDLGSFDPVSAGIFETSAIPTQARPDAYNFGGYSSPEADRLIEEGQNTYDLGSRARAYKALQVTLAEDLPYIFGYATLHHDAVAETLASSSGPLDFASANWMWQPETLSIPR